MFKFCEDKFVGHISTFFKLQSPIRKKQLKILKYVCYKSAIELLLYTPGPLSFSRKTW